jgi:hypothetical protein
MTSFRQIEANRRNARLSTGPVTEAGKQKSRRNAVRHGLTAETVIGTLENADDYAAFELTVTADFDAPTAADRELVLRLASLLWRLRRATAIESGLFATQTHQRSESCQNTSDTLCRLMLVAESRARRNSAEDDPSRFADATASADALTRSFIQLMNLPSYPLDRLGRYEARLWRQANQVLFALGYYNRSHRSRSRGSRQF